jgi:sugar lactone lactonase YvrE
MTARRVVTACVTFTLGAGICAGAEAQSTGTVPSAAGFPESIATAPSGRTYYVSSFATGAVFRGTVGGPARSFLPAGSDGRTSATGLRIDQRGRLLVLTGSSGRLQVFNARSGRLQASIGAGVQPGSNLNDLAIAGNGDVFYHRLRAPEDLPCHGG